MPIFILIKLNIFCRKSNLNKVIKMANSSSYADSEISRIMAITFRNTKDLPPCTIFRSLVAKTLNRSEDSVKRNWNKDPFNY